VGMWENPHHSGVCFVYEFNEGKIFILAMHVTLNKL